MSSFAIWATAKFEDVTAKAKLTHVGHSQSAVFFDYDNDGKVDLFLTNTSSWTSNKFDTHSRYWLGNGDFASIMLSPKEHNVMYRNNGDGTFTDVTEKVGLKGRGWAGDAVAFDYNGDGKMDLFVGCMFGRSQLYRNDGGKFTDVTLSVLKRTPWGAIGTKTFDSRNLGRFDLFVVDMHSDMWMGLDRNHRSLSDARDYQNSKFAPPLRAPGNLGPQEIAEERELIQKMDTRPEEVFFGNAFYRNEGGGKFVEVSEKVGLETFWPWGIADGDFDNDGWVEMFPARRYGLPILLLAQQYADESAQWDVPGPGACDGDRAASAG